MTFNTVRITSLSLLIIIGCQQEPRQDRRTHGGISETAENNDKQSTVEDNDGPDSKEAANSAADEDSSSNEGDQNNAENTPPTTTTSGTVSLSWQKVADPGLVGYRVLASEAGNTVTSQLIEEILVSAVGFDPEAPSYEFDILGNGVIQLYSKPCLKVVAFTATSTSLSSEEICM